MDCLFRCCPVYDTGVSLFSRPKSLVSHLPSISLNSIALTPPDFLFAFVRNPPTVLISLKISWRISCEAIPTKHSILNPQIQEERQRRHNAMTHFLHQECCFSSSEITLLISKDPSLFRRKTTDSTPHQVIQMLRDCGFTVEQVKKTILRNSPLLSCSVDYLKPTIEYLKTIGIAEKDVNFIVSHNPRILSVRLDKTLAPKILFLIKFFGSKANLFEALRKVPGIASCDVELVTEKLKILENAGLKEHEIKQTLVKDPRFLCASVGKIEKNMKFLTCTLGLKPNVVVKYPILLNCSVEKRMRPRYKVFQYLNSSPARHDLTIGLTRILLISEEYFTRRFLSGSPEVKMLYEKYKGKTTDVEVHTKDNLEMNGGLQRII